MVQILQKLLHILNKDQKRKVAGLGVMIFIGALMEMIGVGLIMPVVEGDGFILIHRISGCCF